MHAARGVQPCANWPEWNLFSNRIVQPDGRVIDFSTPALQSTSEDQSYALFFALVANDRVSFERVLRWTDADFAAGGAAVSAKQYSYANNAIASALQLVLNNPLILAQAGRVYRA
ncbi:glycosyl hydrolase family 8 [Mycetohabitans rhizoxinica]|uniref:glycosyl hydrolase family 8 n=1 Tax=Mycetohabitans rhizoxinica TaxID=412963 RepID=UPI003BAE9F8C